MSLPKNFDRTNALVAAGIWLLALVVYARTQAPTLSFWDCGEFIAASYILGIPHPPGTPTYIMFGRIASLIPVFTDICARVNFLSGFCSSLAAMFGYLFGVRILRYWFAADSSRYSRLLIYAGAASGALFLAFGKTQWNNSVEAEVYGMSMMLVFAIAWLTLVYFEHRDTAFGNKVLLLVIYLAFLGIGVHMATFLVLPISAIVFVLKKNTPVKYWFMLAAFFALELYLIFALASRPNEVPYYLPLVLAFFFYICFMLSFERIGWELLTVAGGFLIACAPAVAAYAGWSGGFWTVVGVTGFAGLVLFGLYLIRRALVEPGRTKAGFSGTSVAGVFVIVAALMTGLLQIGLDNGPFGYRVFLVLSVVLAAALGLVIWRYIRFPVLIALAGPAMIVLGVREFFWGTLGALVVVVLLGLIWRVTGWRGALLVIMMAAAGYSTHLFAPIRSSLHPYINENNPSTSLQATINYFERKQYGSQSMTERMFDRRAEWENQFGDHRRMGFWHFFSEQYGLKGPGFVVLLLLGLLGAWEACRRRPEAGLYLVILLMVTSVGLVLYMNFADGIRQTAYDAWLEVRDRDYFFTPAFMIFGLTIGLGISAVIQLLRDLVARFSSGPQKMILASAPVLFLLPVYSLVLFPKQNALPGNYYYCDRSDNHIPYDYARNIMMSAEPDAVMFTYGDNDTFPLWCLQEVYGIRKDLKLICCSLANGAWYIKQIRDYMGVELGWTDEDIDNLRPFRTNDGRVFRIQDQVVDAVAAYNLDKRPVYYSLLAHTGARRLFGINVDSMIEMSGLAYRLTDSVSATGLRIDTDKNRELMIGSGTFQYRGWTNPEIYQSETTQRSLRGVADRFMVLTQALLQENRIDDAIGVQEYLIDNVLCAPGSVGALAGLYAEQGDTAALGALRRERPVLDSVKYLTTLARAYYSAGDATTALAVLSGFLNNVPDSRDALNEIMTIYIAERDVEAMIRTLETWLQNNPGDNEVRRALNDLQRQLNEAGVGGEGQL